MAERITPVCVGVCCEQHAICARYHAVMFSEARTLRIETCGPDRALFMPMFMRPAAPAANVKTIHRRTK